MQKNVNGTVTNFSWEDDNLALELDANCQPIRRYVYGLGKDDVEGYVELSEITGGMFDQSRQGWYSYIKDQVGTIYKVYSDNAKQIIDTRAYDTFGKVINRVGTSTGNLGFQGKYYDKESGLYYFFNRYYNPTNGRFINEDPIGLSGGLNMYGFTYNDPVNEIDLFGLKCTIKAYTGYQFDVGFKWGNLSFKPRINPGDKIGLGLYSRKFTVFGKISLTIICQKVCDDPCDFQEWVVKKSFTIEKSGEIGQGLSTAPFSYYNTAKGGLNIIKSVWAYNRAKKWANEMQKILNSLRFPNPITDLICKMSQ